jgi:predicted DNA-binding transcriptional regulator YafY
VDGEAGVGYILRSDYKLPALTFSHAELEAIALGAEMVQAWGDKELSKNAELALGRIHQVIPRSSRHVLSDDRLVAPAMKREFNAADKLLTVRKAVNAKLRLGVTYQRLDGDTNQRILRPLGLIFWGNVWTLVAWCELRNNFRNFRVDRLSEISPNDVFEDEKGKRWGDFLALPHDKH